MAVRGGGYLAANSLRCHISVHLKWIYWQYTGLHVKIISEGKCHIDPEVGNVSERFAIGLQTSSRTIKKV